ncbi:MAG TPA: TIGR04282 family arsenosugar biosynthesis glycosyltransferase [Solirubrobacteraceae bacterium]|nr:TIGR04282 family arsenosugar biosynthesis glycosyltransferase [Solirubrobacteraceae bacterium]
MPAALVVVAKAPVAGQCKTRLCPPLQPAQAATLAEAALADTLQAVAWTPGASRRVLVLEGEPGPWLPDGFEVVAQRGDGLRERLAHAVADVAEPLLMVGMDTPQVTRAQLAGALGRLDDPAVDAVLGPTADGGYWAIGLCTADPSVFDGVAMSTSETGAAQRARLGSLGLRTTELETLRDVDTFEDAIAVATLAPWTRFAATFELLGVTG